MKKLFAFALALTAITAISCQKEKEIHPVGSKIVFTAATGYMNDVETRTIYSGDYTNTTPNYERIQWLATDDIEILYRSEDSSPSTAKYDISGNISGSGTQQKSTASIAVKTGTAALEWAGGGTHKFYGVYPASNSSNGISITTATVNNNEYGRVSGLSIPNRQTVTWNQSKSKYLPDMDKAYMVSYADYSTNPESTVSLPFTPIMSAFEFKLKLPDDKPSYTVSKVQLSASVAIAGDYSVNITGYDSINDAVTWEYVAPSPNNTATSVVVTFNNGSSATTPAIPDNTDSNGLDFTIFTLPVAISNPVLSIKYSDGTVKKIPLTGLSLAAGQKVVVSNNKAGHDVFDYTVVPNAMTPPNDHTVSGHLPYTWSDIPVTSTRTSRADNTVTENVNWKVQYSLDNGNSWSDGSPTGYRITENQNNNTFTVELLTTNSATATQGYVRGNPYQAATEILRARSALTSTKDLSYLSATGSEITGRTSANCYVVTRAGTYRIPLIYGNAIVNGQTNTYAYNPNSLCTASISGDANQSYFLPTFYNAAGVGIRSPYILTDLGNVGTVSGLSAQVSSLSQTPCISTSDLSVEGSGSSAYIEFTISQSSIQPGNILIDLKGTVGSSISDEVLWSWHIWVTDKDLTPSSGSTIMPYNLGWVDANTDVDSSVRKYSNRELLLRIVQYKTITENGTTTTIILNEGSSFTLTQTGDAESVNNPSDGDKDKGTNPHYQWGRKDPFPMSNSTITLTQRSDVLSSYDYGKGIREPNTMFRSEKSTTWIDGKAIPLYKSEGYRIKSGHEEVGLFTEKEKRELTGSSFNPSGTSFVTGSMEVNNYGHNMTWSYVQAVCLLGNCTAYSGQAGWGDHSGHTPIFTSSDMDYDIPAGGSLLNSTWNIKSGTSITAAQITAINNRKSFLNQYDIASNVDVAPVFLDEGIDKYELSYSSYPYGPHSSTIKNKLTGTGVFSDSDFEESFIRTTDAERKVGSILCNLWSGSLYRENASLPSGGKYKTVYDPCPAGFTVPTVATYLEGTSLSQLSNKTKTNISTFTGYPRTGNRMNGSSGAQSINWNSSTISAGFYWTDHACSMEWITTDPDKSSIDSYRYQTDAYQLHTMENTCSVLPFTRGTAASIRPMVDPRWTGTLTNASPVSSNNSIESVTNGSSLY